MTTWAEEEMAAELALRQQECAHEWRDDGEASDFESGQEYDVYLCIKCGKRRYVEVAQ